MTYLHLLLLPTLFILTSCGSVRSTQTPHSNEMQKQMCQDAQTRVGFLSPSSSGDQPCLTGVQTCIRGQWQGPTLYESCDSTTKSCTGSPHGTIANGYLHPTTQPGVPCAVGTKTCLDGQWSGPILFESCNEVP